MLANLYRHLLDREITHRGWRMVRYADDFVILCGDPTEANAALDVVRAWTEANGLTLHPEKTHLGDCRQALRQKVREKTRRNRSGGLMEIIGELNPMPRGWFEYFKHAVASELKGVDQFVRRRLRALLLRRHHKRGKGQSLLAHRRWPNAYFARHGLFTLQEAHAAACRSR